MPYIHAVLSDPWALSAIFLVAVGLVLAITRRPEKPVSRKHAISLLWTICLGVLAIWSFRQEALVMAGALVSSAQQSVAVPVKGLVYYVAPELAYRHSASMYLLFVCGLGFVAAYKLAGVEDEA